MNRILNRIFYPILACMFKAHYCHQCGVLVLWNMFILCKYICNKLMNWYINFTQYVSIIFLLCFGNMALDWKTLYGYNFKQYVSITNTCHHDAIQCWIYGRMPLDKIDLNRVRMKGFDKVWMSGQPILVSKCLSTIYSLFFPRRPRPPLNINGDGVFWLNRWCALMVSFP